MQADPDRQRHLKNAAAVGALGMSDTAAVLGGAAAIVAVTGGVGTAAVLGVGSAIAWYLSNRYQEVSTDPPRDDFTTVALTPRGRDVAVPTVPGNRDDVWRAFARAGLQLGAALGDLVVSLERYEGAVRADATNDAELQLEAARYNASVSASHHELLVELSPLVNLAWHADLQEAHARGDIGAITAKNVRGLYPGSSSAAGTTSSASTTPPASPGRRSRRPASIRSSRRTTSPGSRSASSTTGC